MVLKKQIILGLKMLKLVYSARIECGKGKMKDNLAFDVNTKSTAFYFKI